MPKASYYNPTSNRGSGSTDKAAWYFTMGFVLWCVAIFFACWGDYEAYKSECREYGELTGYEVRTLKSNRCMVNRPDEGWTPAFRRDE